MKIKTLPLLVSLATGTAVFAAPTMAADIYKSEGASLYGGLNYTFGNVDFGSTDVDVSTLSGKVGGLVTPYFGLEARGGFGVSDDTVNGVDVSLDNFFGGYGTLNLANESPATPYAILGFTRVEYEAEALGLSSKEDESGMSYGVGVNVEITPGLSGNLEYMRYYDDDDVTIDGLGVGATLRF